MIREDIEKYLRELGKSLKKRLKGSEFKIELIIVGGASIILNYDFRESTIDVDAYKDKLVSIKESVRKFEKNIISLIIG